MDSFILAVMVRKITSVSWVLVLLAAIQFSCNLEVSKDSPPVPYDLKNPEIYLLAEELKEISGIAPVPGDTLLLAIQDESGDLYFLDLKGNIVQKKFFNKGGDYEDLVILGKRVFILKSNGNLQFIADYTADSLTSVSYKTNHRFKDGLEFESLAADTLNNRLLLLVKDGEGREGKAPVYGFDLASMDFFPDALALVDPKAAPRVTVKGKNLRASGMSLHPVTGEWYIISSISRMLLVCDGQGNGITKEKLPKKVFSQPEGICFLSDGTLLLTSEGINKPAKLYRFNYQKAADQKK